MGLRQLSYCVVKIAFKCLVWQLGKLLAKVTVDELLHVLLIVTGDLFAFDSSVEEVPVELAHESKAGPHEVAILLKQLRVIAGLHGGRAQVNGRYRRLRLAHTVL